MQICYFSVDKYKTLLYLKKHKSFSEGLLQFFADFHKEKFRSALFTGDRRVTPNIPIFLPNFKMHVTGYLSNIKH